MRSSRIKLTEVWPGRSVYISSDKYHIDLMVGNDEHAHIVTTYYRSSGTFRRYNEGHEIPKKWFTAFELFCLKDKIKL